MSRNSESLPPTTEEKINALLDDAGIARDRDITADMLNAVLKLAKDDPGRGELKLMQRSYKELRYALKIFKPYRQRRKVSVFGSARTPESHPNYQLAARFSKLVAEAGFMVITGAGGGIMAAGHEGAGLEASFGVAIKLPFEQRTNAIIEGDPKLIHFRYFFSRKLIFVKETHAIALFPGGFGTHDEGFEVLTLVQTGRCDPLPIVMIEEAGGTYWQGWDRFIRESLLANHLINPEDMSLYFITQDAQAALEHIQRFYRNYHSCRYVRNELFLRVKHAPTAGELEELNREFGEICTDGRIETRKTQVIDEETLVPEFPRVVLQFDRRSLGKLRLLIDRLNALPSLPPVDQEVAASDTQSQRPDRGVGEIAEEESMRIVEPGI